jgi:hypothetical protein
VLIELVVQAPSKAAITTAGGRWPRLRQLCGSLSGTAMLPLIIARQMWKALIRLATNRRFADLAAIGSSVLLAGPTSLQLSA